MMTGAQMVPQPFFATEETYESTVAQERFAEPPFLDSPIEDARRLVGSDKPIGQTDVVDYSSRRAALKKINATTRREKRDEPYSD
jgi:hypothetical protein